MYSFAARKITSENTLTSTLTSGESPKTTYNTDNNDTDRKEARWPHRRI